jgi:hypothetical protein
LGTPSEALLDSQLSMYQTQNLSAKGSVQWLDHWIANNMTAHTGGNFFDAFTKSITPLIPNLGPGQVYNFKCTITTPCHTEAYPASQNYDARQAWSILIAFQNLNVHYSAQYNFFDVVGTKFLAAYADNFWNALKEDGGQVKYPATMLSLYSGAKDCLKIMEKFYEEQYKAKFAGVSLKALSGFLPVADLTLNIVQKVIGSKDIPASVGSGSLKQKIR